MQSCALRLATVACMMAVMPGVSTFPLANLACGGNLANILRRWRDQGESYEQIARRLGDLHDLDVTSSTVRRWVIDLDAPEVAS